AWLCRASRAAWFCRSRRGRRCRRVAAAGAWYGWGCGAGRVSSWWVSGKSKGSACAFAVGSFDLGDAHLEMLVPVGTPPLLRQLVLGVRAPCADGFFTAPVGQGDAQAAGMAHAFHAEVAGLLRSEFNHAGGHLS